MVILTLDFCLITMATTSDTTKPMKPMMMRTTPKLACTLRRKPWKIKSTSMAAGMTRTVPTLHGDMETWGHGNMKNGSMGTWRMEAWGHENMVRWGHGDVEYGRGRDGEMEYERGRDGEMEYGRGRDGDVEYGKGRDGDMEHW